MRFCDATILDSCTQKQRREGYSGLDRTILSQASCAHVNGLMDPYGYHDEDLEV